MLESLLVVACGFQRPWFGWTCLQNSFFTQGVLKLLTVTVPNFHLAMKLLNDC